MLSGKRARRTGKANGSGDSGEFTTYVYLLSESVVHYLAPVVTDSEDVTESVVDSVRSVLSAAAQELAMLRGRSFLYCHVGCSDCLSQRIRRGGEESHKERNKNWSVIL